MNIEDLTIKQARELVDLFGSKTSRSENSSGMVGNYVIVRCRDAGVHAGALVSQSGRECVLSNSRRLWYWKAKKGAFLSAVSLYGVDSVSKIGPVISDIYLSESCEIIPCLAEAAKSITDQPSHNE